jgi:hypothetical protein
MAEDEDIDISIIELLEGGQSVIADIIELSIELEDKQSVTAELKDASSALELESCAKPGMAAAKLPARRSAATRESCFFI